MAKKTCPRCGTSQGPRTIQCKNTSCQYFFRPKAETKEKKSRTLITDFSALTRGDLILVKSGPYFPSKTEGEPKLKMADKGRMKFIKELPNGILAYSKEGFTYLYTGEEFTSEITGVVMRPYKIFSVRKRTLGGV